MLWAEGSRFGFHVAARKKGVFTHQYLSVLGKPTFSTESANSGRSSEDRLTPKTALDNSQPPSTERSGCRLRFVCCLITRPTMPVHRERYNRRQLVACFEIVVPARQLHPCVKGCKLPRDCSIQLGPMVMFLLNMSRWQLKPLRTHDVFPATLINTLLADS